MFQIIRFALQICLKQYSLGDKASCRKFVENLLKLIKPAATASKTKIDDKIIAHLETIVKNDVLFDYFYNLIRDHFESEVVLFESPDESAIALLCEKAAKDSPQTINPMIIVALVSQIIALVNSLKK